MKIDKNCKFCNTIFKADKREINRGNALFCSLSCASSYNSSLRSTILHICKHCGRDFNSQSNYSRYCSKSCKLKNYRLNKKSGNSYDQELELVLRSYPCEICSWNECTRDVHHIIPVSKGGKNLLTNLITLCPNHHIMADKGLLSQDYLLKIAKSRTISSSLEALLIKIRSKEQDANSGN